MPDNAKKQHLDDSLAEFTDRIIGPADKSRKDTGEPGEQAQRSEDEELARLQQTVLQIQRAAPNQPPRPFMERLHHVLLAEYRQIQKENRRQLPAGSTSVERSWLQHLSDWFRVPQHRLMMRLALVTVGLLALSLFFFPTLNPALPGAAGMSEYRPWAALALGAACAALVIWLVREKK